MLNSHHLRTLGTYLSLLMILQETLYGIWGLCSSRNTDYELIEAATCEEDCEETRELYRAISMDDWEKAIELITDGTRLSVKDLAELEAKTEDPLIGDIYRGYLEAEESAIREFKHTRKSKLVKALQRIEYDGKLRLAEKDYRDKARTDDAYLVSIMRSLQIAEHGGSLIDPEDSLEQAIHVTTNTREAFHQNLQSCCACVGGFAAVATLVVTIILAI